MAKKSLAPTTQGARFNDLVRLKGYSQEQAVRAILGELNPFIPPGSRIINQSLGYVEYIDPQGYTHRLQRNQDATSPMFGQVKEDSDRPAIPPLEKQNPELAGVFQNAINAVNANLGGTGLRPLSESDLAMLKAISDSEQAQLNQQAQRTQGELVTQLYGQGINQSTIANQAGADFAQAIAIALGQQQANAAQRKLGLQEFLTNLSTQTGSEITKALAGLQTTRDVAGAGLNFDMEKFQKNLELALQQLPTAQLYSQGDYQQRFKSATAPSGLSRLASIALGIGLAPLTGGGSLFGLGIGALGDLLKKGSGGGGGLAGLFGGAGNEGLF